MIIGICGAAQSGKSTVAKHLVAKYGNCGVTAISFADALKIEVFEWLQTLGTYLVHTDLFNALDIESVPTPALWQISDAEKIAWVDLNKRFLRPILQTHGTELRRAQDSEYWIDRFLERAAEDGARIVLVPDTRFLNETNVCHVVIKVEQIGQVEDPVVASHVSEREWRKHDFRDNVIRAAKGDLATLQKESERVFERILERFHVQ